MSSVAQAIPCGIKAAPAEIAQTFEQTRPKANELLNQNSSKFDIEYGNLKLSNHLSHGLVALWALGASEDLLDGFYKSYTTRNHYNEYGVLDPIAPPSAVLQSKKELEKWKGKGENFSGLLAFFKEQLASYKKEDEATALKRLLLEYVPQFIDGVASAAFHGLIQVGYGLEFPHETAVLEGLAYWTLVYSPLGNLLNEPVSVLKPFSVGELGLRDPVELVNHVYDSFQENFGGVLPADIKVQSRFMRRVRPVSNRFAFLLNRVDYGIRHLVNNAKDRDTKRQIIDAALKKMLHAIVAVYACSKDDFFVLHLVTAGRSLRTLLNALAEDTDENLLFQARAIDYFWRATVASYIGQSFPKIDARWFDIPSGGVPSWENIIAKSLDSAEKEEHEYKLVFVLYYFAHEKYFSKTPEDDDRLDSFLRLITARKVGLLSWELSN